MARIFLFLEMFPHEHKTTFVLDHSPFFATPCGEPADVDVIKGTKTTICKSLWTCAVEAALEYHRIVTDLFPNDRLLRYVISDSVGRVITEEWSEEAMALERVMLNFANVGPPDAKGDQTNFCILNGVTMAVEALTKCSPKQNELVRSGVEVQNRGRIVVVTHLKQLEEIKMIEDRVEELIADQNKLVKTLPESFLPLTHLELCLVNTYPMQGEEMKLPSKPGLHKISEFLSSEFHSCRSGTSLAFKMHGLVQSHYELASTTVTGIPMKEEQNSGGSSANYDVELLHHKSAHEELEKTGLATDNGLFLKRDGYNTFTLKWCTPAAKTGSGGDQIYATHAACRCTPVEVNSRPSACLTSFLMAGRTVILELPKKLAATKVTSHMLTCHGGHIYIHGLSLGRSPVDEPPSISDTAGGRVTDYRIAHFVDFMKECLLQPPDVPTASIERAKQHVQRLSAFWPMTLGESVLFSMTQRFEPLISLMKKRQLTENEASECKKVILHLLNLEKNTNDPLGAASSQCAKLKGLKREEHYAIVFGELESYIRNYSHLSPTHHSILNCLVQCNGKPMEPYVKLKEIESVREPPTPDLTSTVSAKRFGDIRDGCVVTENPESPPSKRGRSETTPSEEDSGPIANLLTLTMKKYEDKTATWRDFDARAKAGANAKVDLYPELTRKMEEESKKGTAGASANPQTSTPAEKGSAK